MNHCLMSFHRADIREQFQAQRALILNASVDHFVVIDVPQISGSIAAHVTLVAHPVVEINVPLERALVGEELVADHTLMEAKCRKLLFFNVRSWDARIDRQRRDTIGVIMF